MKKIDLTQLSLAELQEKLQDEQNALRKMKFNHSISPIESPVKIRTAKKTIARLLTEIRRRELSKMSEQTNKQTANDESSK